MLLLLLMVLPASARAAEPPAKPAVVADDLEVLVESAPGLRLADVYRTSSPAAFVTADAAIAAYGILRRDLEYGVARVRDGQLGFQVSTLQLTWQISRLMASSLSAAKIPTREPAASPAPARPRPPPSRAEIRQATLLAMYGDAPTDPRLAGVVGEAVARLQGMPSTAANDAPRLSVDAAYDPYPDETAAEAFAQDPVGRAARWRVLSGQMSGQVQDTLLPRTFADDWESLFAEASLVRTVSRLTPLLELRRWDDAWMGTPAERLVPVWPSPTTPPNGTTLAAMAQLLGTLASPPPAAPAVIRSPAYRALLHGAAIGGDVLARAGPMQRGEPATPLPVSSGRCLVHPDPAFWRSMARLCEALAEEAPRHALGGGKPGEGESAPPRPPHSSIALAARLARFCTRFAARAELQLAGGALPEPDEMRWRWAAFVEEVGGGGGGDPLVVDVRTTVEGGRRVRVGLAGLARVRLRYPLPGESVLCEGIAFVVRDPRTAAPADAPRDAR